MKTYLIDFSHRRPFLTFAGSHDLFGDGAVVVLSMPGHDADNLGVFARTPQGPLLLAGDAAYTMRNIREMILPGYLADPCRAWDSLYRLKRLTERAPPIAVIPSHDPEAWKVIATPESQ
jgi:glyoxylase-like metal-dependent hydrolase (beta-lactamase superfamily II)